MGIHLDSSEIWGITHTKNRPKSAYYKPNIQVQFAPHSEMSYKSPSFPYGRIRTQQKTLQDLHLARLFVQSILYCYVSLFNTITSVI